MNLKERIESVILSNLQPKEERKIGIECESIFYNKKMQRLPVNQSDDISAIDIKNELEGLQEGDSIKSGYTIEPGGQIEWASPPLRTIKEIDNYYQTYLKRIEGITQRENFRILDFSLEPLYDPSEIQLIDNQKYLLMDKLFKKSGKLGPWMMRNTASIQINIDYSSQEEAERMAFIADCLTPIISIFFANSPFWNGQPAGKQNLRYTIWNATDNNRCGDLLTQGMVSKRNLISKYAVYIQSVPAIFILDDCGNVIEFNGTLGEWLSKLEDEERLTDDAIQTALHQIFTHVRFKNVIEIRGCDKPPAGFELAPAAFWTGLLLDDGIQDEIYSIVKKWTQIERMELIERAFYLKLNQPGPQNKSIKEWIGKLCGLSMRGLKNREGMNKKADETSYLGTYIDFFNINGIPSIFTQNQLNKSRKTIKDLIK